MAAQRLCQLIVTRGQQRAANGALGAVLLDLQLMLGVPARVVADKGDEGQPATHRRVELQRVEAEGPVP